MIFRINANTIVLNEENSHIIFFSTLANNYMWTDLFPLEFRCIVDQVLQCLYQALTIPVDGRQVRFKIDRDVVGFELPVDVIQRFIR